MHVATMRQAQYQCSHGYKIYMHNMQMNTEKDINTIKLLLNGKILFSLKPYKLVRVARHSTVHK